MAITGKGRALDDFNAQLRANPEYRAFLQSMGVNPDAPIKLTGDQRSRADRWVEARYPQVAGKLQIDPAGNVNTDHGLSTAWSNPWFRYPLIAGGALATAGALGAGPLAGALGGGSGATAGGATAGGGLLPGISGAQLGAMQTAGIAPAAGMGASGGALAAGSATGSVFPLAAGTASGGGSALMKGLKNAVPNSVQDIAGLAALAPMFMGGGGSNPFSDTNVSNEISQTLALQRQRMQQAQPVYDALVNMAYGMSPTRYRGATAPAGSTANAAPEGAYRYQAPTFGGR